MAEPSSAFKQRLKAAFDEVHEGQTFTFQRTFTSGDVALFCGVTGDYNPYHIDYAFIEESWFEKPIIPGLLTASMLTHLGGMIGFLATEMTFEFVGAVHLEDTITCTFTVEKKDEANRRLSGSAMYVNQAGQVVLRAEVTGFPSLVRLAR
jgi:3-hydroxybutyryl-CoA dehydratase